jgi:type I restriction enzyme S subunit
MILTAFREDFVEYANLRSTGTRMPRASAKDMLNFPIMIPGISIAESFEAMASTHWKRGMQSIEESRNLASLRNTLLPKLLSGQLRIPEAEQQLAEAL